MVHSNLKMKAAVLMEPNEPLQIIELPVPPPKRGQVLVKMMATGICHTQLLEISGQNTNRPMNPNLLGHEGSGIVEEVGEGILKVKKGDHVILSWIKGNGANVLPDKYNLNGQEINAGFVTTFNEYCLASENRVTKISKEMPFPEASLIGCAVATGGGAVLNNANVKKDHSVLVVGVGGIGINMAHVSSYVGANPIIAVDINDEKLEFSKKFGATYTINSKNKNLSEVDAEIREVVGEGGLDYAFETTGRKEIMEFIYNSVKKSTGIALFCGVPKPLNLKIEIDPFPLYFGRRIVGTGGGESNPDIDFPKYCQMFLDGKLKLSEMITHTFSLDKINEGIELMKKGECCRVVIDFTKEKEVLPELINTGPISDLPHSENKKKYKVIYKRKDCIGVLTCTAFYPKRWVINKDDALADLVGGTQDPDNPGTWTLFFTEDELDQFKSSAEVCPVNVIEIYDIESGNKLS